jgi:hypothetical protein
MTRSVQSSRAAAAQLSLNVSCRVRVVGTRQLDREPSEPFLAVLAASDRLCSRHKADSKVPPLLGAHAVGLV